MRGRTLKLGAVLAVLNVLIFSIILALKAPAYEKLRKTDETVRETGRMEFTTADPMHLAARPFYSSAHVSDVPVIEDLYFLLNTPAMHVALSAGYPLADITSDFWARSPRPSSVWESWTLAITFALFSAIWAFAIGAGVGWWREQRQLRR